MSSSVKVRSVQALEHLRSTLKEFSGRAQGSLKKTARKNHRVLEWLDERRRHWEREVRYWQEEVRRAKTPAQYRRAMKRLRAAEAELRNVQRWISTVKDAITDFERQSRHLADLLSNDLPKSTARLDSSIAALKAYSTQTASSGTSEVPVGSSRKSAVQTKQSHGHTISAKKGVEFEAWAAENIFRGKRRITVPVELNQHLNRVDDDDIGPLKRRSSDNYVSDDGSLWDAKAYDENAVIDRDQLRDYSLMERAGYIVDAQGNHITVTSVNYLFSDRAAAEKNIKYIWGEANVWYVQWREDGTGAIQQLEDW